MTTNEMATNKPGRSQRDNDRSISLDILDISIERASDDENDDSNGTPKEKTERRQIIYTKIATFGSYTEAHESLIEDGFKKHEKRREIYRCGNIRQKSKQQC